MFFTVVFLIQQIIVLFEYQGTTFTASIVQDYLDKSYTYEGEEFPIAIAIVDQSQPDFRTKTGLTMHVFYDSFVPPTGLVHNV